MIPSAPLGTDAVGRLGLGAAAGAGPSGVAAERRFRFELAAHPASPAQARRLARARLSGWAVCEDICDTAVLVISELVTNALVHTASSSIVCELHDGEDLVRIAVRDEGCAPGEPRPGQGTADDEHGRGLLLIEAMCHAWGAHEQGPGLMVWAELPRQTDTPRHRCGPCNDLGWGARPKPGPTDGTDDNEPVDTAGTTGTARTAGAAEQAGAAGTPEAARPTGSGQRTEAAQRTEVTQGTRTAQGPEATRSTGTGQRSEAPRRTGTAQRSEAVEAPEPRRAPARPEAPRYEAARYEPARQEPTPYAARYESRHEPARHESARIGTTRHATTRRGTAQHGTGGVWE
ncbi:ATP-binding protein [Streptomyces doudnae]|uniref:ATP-binding protein n=1 Tax=Streptomyces doudnae TaxID=3075536 RepID=UPI00374E1136